MTEDLTRLRLRFEEVKPPKSFNVTMWSWSAKRLKLKFNAMIWSAATRLKSQGSFSLEVAYAHAILDSACGQKCTNLSSATIASPAASNSDKFDAPTFV
jgi:hypothetical protein